MANLGAVLSYQIQDSRSEVTSYEDPILVADTVTLAALVTAVQGFGVTLDTVTDGQITKIRACILVPLPAGIKAAPIAGSDNEKTGLLTMSALTTRNKYGVDLPAIPNSQLTGNQINQAAPSMAAFITALEASGGTIQHTDRYSNALTNVFRGLLTFRKHRRALRRA